MYSKIIPYGRQNITKEDIDAVVKVLKSDYLTQGPKNFEFEKEFAKYVGSKYAVAVSNGTAALHLCNLALGVKKGDKVLFGKWSGTEVTVDGEDLLIMKESDLLGIIDAPKKKK